MRIDYKNKYNFGTNTAHNAACGGRNFWQNNEWGNFITRSLHSDYEIYCYAVILSLIRWELALMSLIIRSWYSVF